MYTFQEWLGAAAENWWLLQGKIASWKKWKKGAFDYFYICPVLFFLISISLHSLKTKTMSKYINYSFTHPPQVLLLNCPKCSVFKQLLQLSNISVSVLSPSLFLFPPSLPPGCRTWRALWWNAASPVRCENNSMCSLSVSPNHPTYFKWDQIGWIW